MSSGLHIYKRNDINGCQVDSIIIKEMILMDVSSGLHNSYNRVSSGPRNDINGCVKRTP